MGCEPPWPEFGFGRVVHVVGRATDEVFSFLGPATNALAHSGLRQAVVVIDDAHSRRHLPRIHKSAELVLTPSLRNPIHQWREVQRACRLVFAAGPLQAVHLHGLLPCLAGAGAVRSTGLQPPIFFSPHGSRPVGSLGIVGALVLFLIRPLFRPLPRAAIVTLPREAFAFERWESVALVENPVSQAFHRVPRNEARQPLVVTGGRVSHRRGVERFAQLAVLLGGEDLRVSFNWIGTVDAASRQRLDAANVGVFDVANEEECASRLAAAWIYTAPWGTRGFPLFLAQAMAAALPCVAADCPQHRGVIRHGETGFLCRSERDMIGRIAALLDKPTLRARIGGAAREEARRRFGEQRFSTSLLAAYTENVSGIDDFEMLEVHG
jgi:glycosyltransferase involved in cell wall biosynthesis